MAETRFDPVAHAKSMRGGGLLDRQELRRISPAVDRRSRLKSLRCSRIAPTAWKAGASPTPSLATSVSRAAASLKRMGIGRGDVISVQLPNWWEFAVIALAAFRVGAVVNPLMPIFREHELSYMLDFAGDEGLRRPKLFRGFDHEAMAKALRPDLPKLAHIVVVDGEGPDSFQAALLSSEERLAPPPIGDIGALPADEMAVLMFTSGTTGSPKGVMHCLNTLMACNIALAGRFGLDSDDTMLVCSPLGHMTGFRRRDAARIQDRRERDLPGRLGAEAGRLHHGGRRRHLSPPARATFLSDMCEAVAAGAPKPTLLRKFLCAGAPIPPALIERVYRELDLKRLLAVGHDGVAVEHADGTRTGPGKVLEDGRPAPRRRRGQGRQAGRQPRPDRRDRLAPGSRRPDVPGILQAARHAAVRRRRLV